MWRVKQAIVCGTGINEARKSKGKHSPVRDGETKTGGDIGGLVISHGRRLHLQCTRLAGFTWFQSFRPSWFFASANMLHSLILHKSAILNEINLSKNFFTLPSTQSSGDEFFGSFLFYWRSSIVWCDHILISQLLLGSISQSNSPKSF